jgi:hypothetical protein
MVGARRTSWLALACALAAALGGACGGSDLLLPGDTQPAAIAIIKGNNQSGSIGATLAESLVVKVTDGSGRPVAQLPVAFVLGAGSPGGALAPDTALTDAAGVARSSWALGTTAGTQVAEARVVGSAALRAEFTATASGGAGSLTIVTQPSATAVPGVPLARQPQVQALDALGAPVHQAGLAIQVAIASGTGVTLSGQLTVATDATGLASFSGLALNGTSGTVTLRFAGAGFAPVESSPIALASGGPSAQRSTLAAQPGTIAAVTGTSTVTATILDQAGAPLAAVTVTPATSGAGAFTPASAVTNAQGVATFSFGSPTPGTETLSATAAGVAIAHTVSVSVIKAATTTTITSDAPDPSLVTQGVTVAFTVTGGGIAPTGNVTVSDGSASCTAAVSAGSCQLVPTSAGTKTLTATYAGDVRYKGSSGSTPHVVSLIPSHASLADGVPNPSVYGADKVLFTATVTADLGSPTGDVRFVDLPAIDAACGASNVRVLGRVTLDGSGQATYQSPAKNLSVGTHYIRACYLGDANHVTFAPSESNVVQQRVVTSK